MIWKLLKHLKKHDAWGDPERMNPILLFLLDDLMINFPRGSVIKVHCGWKKNTNSLHAYGKAVDFHIMGIDFLTAESLIISYLERNELMEYVGFGIYPDWADPGFHIDVRGKRTLWGQISGQHSVYEECLAYAREKFKNG